MASSTGESSREATSFQLLSRDLPSKRLLGKGLAGFGYETTWKGERYARKDFIGVPSDIFVQEAAVLVGLKDQKNLVKTYGWTVDKRSCSLVLEYMDDDLLSLLQKKAESRQNLAGIGFGNQSSTSTSTQPFDLPEVLDIILQLATGMKYLHEQGISHGDLKTKNILVTYMKDGDQELKVVKVADFGLIRTKRKSKSIVSFQVRKLNIVKWKAPEYLKILFRRLNVSNVSDETSSKSNSESEFEETSTPPVVRVDVFAADVYSFAVTCSQILTGKDPYPNLDWKDLGDKILCSGLRPHLPDACPLLLRNLLISCWGDSAQRPTFSEIHKWFQEHRDEILTPGACKEPGANSYSTLANYPFQPSNELSIETLNEHVLTEIVDEHIPTETVDEHISSEIVDVHIPIETDDEHISIETDHEHKFSIQTDVERLALDVPAQTPQHFLELSTKCMDQVFRMIRRSASLKFNKNQCNYLAHKLRIGVQSAKKFFEQMINIWKFKFDSEDRARSLETFKLLFVLGKGAQSFIQSCCEDVWVKSAIILLNVSEHVATLGFNLALCTLAFSRGKEVEGSTVKNLEGAEVWNIEAEIVKQNANLDELRLYEDVKRMIQSTKKSSSKWVLGTFLLQRLERQRKKYPGSAFLGLDQFNHPGYLSRGVKEMKKVGSGSTGNVYKGEWQGIEVAMKTYYGTNDPDFETQVKILEGLHHSNVVSLLWYFRDQSTCYMIMELMDGDLFSLIQKRKRRNYHDSPFSMFEAIHIMLQVAEGMLYVHEKKIVHRDLKSRNILVNCVKVNMEVEFVHAKVADFALSETKEHTVTYSPQTPNIGTTRWMAPELIEMDIKIWNDKGLSAIYPFKCDIYSFAMVCFEILTGDIPFGPCSSLRELKKQVLTGRRPQLPNRCPCELKNLIEACWSQIPSERPHFGEICVELRNLKSALLIQSTSIWMKSREDKGAGLPTKRDTWGGHIPKFDAPKVGNFTETFAIARPSGIGSSGKPRASKPEDTTNPKPPTRRLMQRARPAAMPVTVPTRRPARTKPKPIPVSEGGLYGDAHIPTFGTWNVDGDQNYPSIFQAASKAKKSALEPASGGTGSGGSGDRYNPHHSKKRSSSWCCFGP